MDRALIRRISGRRWMGLALAAVLLCAGMLACTRKEPLKIGFVAGISGRVADLGISGLNGATLAVEEINRKGGIGGRQVMLLVRDDEQNPDAARKAVLSLMDEKVEAVIGHMTSSMSMTTLPLFNEKKMVLISPTTTTEALRGIDDYFFRVIDGTSAYAGKAALHLLEGGKTRVAAVYDLRNKAYTQSWFDDFTAEFEKRGGQLVHLGTFESGPDTAFLDLAKAALEKGPQAVLLISSAMDAAILCQQIRKLDKAMPIITSEWAATEQLIELGGPAVEGVELYQFFDRDSTLPNYLAFRKAYVERFSTEPGFASVAGYDAASVLLQSFQKTEGGRPLKEVLLGVGSFEGAQGPVSMDRFGDSKRQTFLATVRGGRFVRMK